MRGRFRRLAAGLLALGVAAGAAGAPARAASVLRGRLNADILSTDPGTKRDENTDAVLLHVVEGLVAFREDASVGPMLAQSWDVSRDGLTYTFHLRRGVRFHNGAPMTAAEVVWSLDRYLDPKTHWRCLSEFDGHGQTRIVKVQALDPATVAIQLDKPSILFLKTLARADCGETAILSPASVSAKGAWIRPIGTGPFMFTTWRPNEYVELTRYRGYAALPGPRDGNAGGKHALVDKVRFLVIPDGSAAEGALLSGAIDVLDGVSPSNLADLRASRGVRLDAHSTMDIYALIFQTRDPVMRDARLRRALALAIDDIGLTRVVTQKTAQANSALVPTSSAFHVGVQAQVVRPDLAKARALVAASGYRGQPITLITNRRYPQMFDSAVLIQAMAKTIGVDIRIQALDWAAELDRYNHGAYQAMTFAYSARLDPSQNYGAVIGAKTSQPNKVWDDPFAKALLKASTATADVAQRQALFDQLHQRMLAQAPLVVLYNPSHVAAVRDGVVGFRTWSTVQQRLWDVSVR
ncbi:MAG: ABC transporter substrate-binding protein [Caulobacteraceae bacterium]|nr:ABC transporter substrate-binding protein [Caulobacteraceae bacterium]